jgi:hypothetical protein
MDNEMVNQAQPPEPPPPWYRQFWPWVLIAIPALTVIASAVTLWLALSNPDYLVVDDVEYQRIRNEMRAQDPAGDGQNAETPPAPDDNERP